MQHIIIADKQDLTAAGWLHLIQDIDSGAHISFVKNKKELIKLCSQKQIALVILDYSLFDFERIEELLFLQEKYKQTHWIVSSDELSLSAISVLLNQSKRISILLKDSVMEDCISAIKLSIKGERYISSYISNMLLMQNKPKNKDSIGQMLTPTEREILKEMALGKSTREIAAHRNVSMHTIMTHRKNIFRKIEVNNVHEATKYAMKAGLIDLAEYYI